MTKYTTEKELPAYPPDVGRPATRTAVTLAYLAPPLIVLPAGVWRTIMGFGFPMGFSTTTTALHEASGHRGRS
jgi:hypothetical protein